MSPMEEPIVEERDPVSGAAAAAPAKPPAAGVKAYGAVAEFDTPEALLHAVRVARARGYEKLDAYTPFPIHGIDHALGARRSKLGWVVLCGGFAGAAAALLLQWWTGAVDYPLVIGGKPLFAVEFSVPITFELTVLFASLGAVFGMLAFNGLPRFYHPIFQHPRFRHATDDKFLLAIEADSDDFDGDRATEVLEAAGGRHAEVIAE